MTDEEWVNAATADDSMVVELLLRLHQATPSPPPPALPLDWSVRQPRSKSIVLMPTTARASPTTPLSWSGATSQSGGAGGAGAVDGSEESSRPAPGSKVTGTSETITTKRTRKRKTITELKEGEVLLLKERRHLKRELATLRVNLEEERVTNEMLKRMKMDLPMQPEIVTSATFTPEKTIYDQTLEKLAASDRDPIILPPSVAGNDPAALPVASPQNSCLEVQKEVANQENKFVLPDLNVALDEYSSEVPHGMS